MCPQACKEEPHLGAVQGERKEGESICPVASHLLLPIGRFTPVGRTLPVLWGLSLSSSVARSVLWDVVFYPDLEAERGPVLVVCQPGETKTAAERPEQAPVGAILLRLQNTLKPVE